MEKYIPDNGTELVKKMKENNFKGDYYIKNNIVFWKIHPEVEIEIFLHNQRDEAYVLLPNGGHEHVEEDELWEYLYSLNEEGGILVIKKGLFGEKKKIHFDKNIKISKGKVIYF